MAPKHRGRPLRHRMVLTVVTLAATGLIVTDLAGVTLLRSFLVGRVDSQLEDDARDLAHADRSSGAAAQSPNQLAHLLLGGSTPAANPTCKVYVYTADGTRLYPSAATGDGGPDLNPAATLEARADAPPFTLAGPGGDWRVLVTSVSDGRQYVVHALSIREVAAAQRTFVFASAAVAVLVLVLIAFAAASVVRVGLRPFQVALADRGASERRLQRFLADASHELRTPLTSIQGFAELYRRGGAPPGPALDEAMGRIEAEVGRMRLLVNDLLLLARLDEERPLERHPVDLLAVAADAVRDAHVRVPSRFVQLAALDDDSETFEAVTVFGDEPRIRQIVNNLVVNALQHTPEECAVMVRIGGSVASAPDPEGDTEPLPAAVVGAALPTGQSVAIIEVADSGPGMSAAEARHAFERLYRADSNRSRRAGGTGLGLAIVATIAQAHGGRVELYTAAGVGARFRVLLPARPADAHSASMSTLAPVIPHTWTKQKKPGARHRAIPRDF
ncbi:HAMP domain-containing histidine kinase [Planosporangium flavigriseum]|uniref:histidine kinase n=1 Tax=Planosporangium flavigriseum TaxID=373681 RepID=A0A8J3LPI4_9ACTN|nr:HAMP domain-containing sensor histidine kinase [Planosporangium flavigriseum]NJC67098.1 HAMP domain-containing histidine kinase [Planosporangium flavigriseum]GIG75502.1 two-component sensor histidine kinase [Planosporangium flavigriseum]